MVNVIAFDGEMNNTLDTHTHTHTHTHTEGQTNNYHYFIAFYILKLVSLVNIYTCQSYRWSHVPVPPVPTALLLTYIGNVRFSLYEHIKRNIMIRLVPVNAVSIGIETIANNIVL